MLDLGRLHRRIKTCLQRQHPQQQSCRELARIERNVVVTEDGCRAIDSEPVGQNLAGQISRGDPGLPACVAFGAQFRRSKQIARQIE